MSLSAPNHTIWRLIAISHNIRFNPSTNTDGDQKLNTYDEYPVTNENRSIIARCGENRHMIYESDTDTFF